jgi:hypothetical protein
MGEIKNVCSILVVNLSGTDLRNLGVNDSVIVKLTGEI